MATFLRYEKKFLVTQEQHDALLDALKEDLIADKNSINGFYNVYNIYLDDASRSTVRNSVDRPIFKEKMRIRSYSYAGDNDEVYLEVKKKLNGYGSKRRIKIPYNKTIAFIEQGIKPVFPETDYIDNQIVNELASFLKCYHVKPFVYLETRREAYSFKSDPDLRITFDTNVQYRYDHLDFQKRENSGVLNTDGKVICEIKFKGAIPYELSTILSSLGIYRTHMSKIGSVYVQDNQDIMANLFSQSSLNNNTNKNNKKLR